jgi:hypothetical protein
MNQPCSKAMKSVKLFIEETALTEFGGLHPGDIELQKNSIQSIQ